MALTTTEAETLQTTVREYFNCVDRSGNFERMADRIALKQSHGARLVGFRRRGHEVFLFEEQSKGSGELCIYEVDVDGSLHRIGTVWKGQDIIRWLRENRFYLDWIAPEWRAELE